MIHFWKNWFYIHWQVRRGFLEFPNEAGDLGELERKLLDELEGEVMPAIEDVDKVCHRKTI